MMMGDIIAVQTPQLVRVDSEHREATGPAQIAGAGSERRNLHNVCACGQREAIVRAGCGRRSAGSGRFKRRAAKQRATRSEQRAAGRSGHLWEASVRMGRGKEKRPWTGGWRRMLERRVAGISRRAGPRSGWHVLRAVQQAARLAQHGQREAREHCTTRAAGSARATDSSYGQRDAGREQRAASVKLVVVRRLAGSLRRATGGARAAGLRGRRTAGGRRVRLERRARALAKN
ncbi:hypothetical protein GGX14DRAFT_386566 [Mycena pura]|uniref:Uncharacterized protein n=1 Tax=Mycena pura TaxID=153505 RepID=A0AAD7E354_9AGAR|nr:hypothetical protein GGX14DRAFT_386566 [Mycena pura]